MEKETLYLKDGKKYDITLRADISKELCFPKQPTEHLLEFRFDGKAVAFIDANGCFTCLDKAKLIDVLISVPQTFATSAEFNRKMRVNELLSKYPWLEKEWEAQKEQNLS